MLKGSLITGFMCQDQNFISYSLRTFNQCNCLSTGVMWSLRGDLVKMRAVWFCTFAVFQSLHLQCCRAASCSNLNGYQLTHELGSHKHRKIINFWSCQYSWHESEWNVTWGDYRRSIVQSRSQLWSWFWSKQCHYDCDKMDDNGSFSSII